MSHQTSLPFSERRAHRRITLDYSQTVHISDHLNCPVKDLSLGGLSFLSTISQEVDKVIPVDFGGKLFQLDAVVLECRMVETDSALMEYHYLIRCRFLKTVLHRFLVDYIAKLPGH